MSPGSAIDAALLMVALESISFNPLFSSLPDMVTNIVFPIREPAPTSMIRVPIPNLP